MGCPNLGFCGLMTIGMTIDAALLAFITKVLIAKRLVTKLRVSSLKGISLKWPKILVM
ncbi:hypothetical protein LguiB_023924 [Lonicera macranthoides]